MKKILMCTAATLMIADFAVAHSGTYVGLGLGVTSVNSENKIAVEGNTSAGDDISVNLGKRKLKDRSSATGKLLGGYEVDLSNLSLLTEVGIALDDTEARYDNNITVVGAFDDATPAVAPVITSTSMKRKYTFSIGGGVKKKVTKKVSVLAGLDILYSRFEVKSKGTGTFGGIYSSYDVTKRKSKFGLGPWVGVSWDLGAVQTGVRYQYSRYQTVKAAGDFVPGDFAVSNKIKPEYHTISLTISKKF